MKPIQITMDPELLAELDALPEVAQGGRSAVLRQAVAEYLERRRRADIRDRYREAYAGSGGLGEGFTGWVDEGAWPHE